jgi:hypothetical protein
MWVVVLYALSDVFLFHTRKAGGTSLRAWLKAERIDFSVAEGYNLRRKKGKEVWVTSIRDPVNRLWSSFTYEGRWVLRNNNFTGGGVPFEDWLARTSTPVCSAKTWQCSENCFTRWYSGCTSGKIDDSFEAAVRGLAQFDVVVNVDRLGDNRYHDKVMRCLNATTRLPRVLPWMGRASKRANEAWPAKRVGRGRLAKLNALDYALLAPYWYRDPCVQGP